MLNGFHGSGKDTLGRLIIEKNPNYMRFALADTVKDIAAERYGFERKLADIPGEKDKPRKEHNNMSIRDMGRAIWMEIYSVDKTTVTRKIAEMMQIEIKKNPNVKFVITDFRYDHDFIKLCEIFGREHILTVKITRDCVQKPDRVKEPEEYALEHFKFDLNINNNESFDKLYETIKNHI